MPSLLKKIVMGIRVATAPTPQWTAPLMQAYVSAMAAAVAGRRSIMDGADLLTAVLTLDGPAMGAKLLTELGVDLGELRTALEDVRDEEAPERVLLPRVECSPDAQQALNAAVGEAKQFGHRHLGTEHLVLGFLACGVGRAYARLTTRGACLKVARQRTLALMGADMTREPLAMCPICSYSLRGNVSGVCPECGTRA